MSRFERILLFIIIFGCIGFDVWTFSSRCSASPPVSPVALAFGAIIQLVAIALPVIVSKQFSDESPGFRLRCALVALMLAVVSVTFLRTGILYSDSIGRPNYYRSVGMQCNNSLF